MPYLSVKTFSANPEAPDSAYLPTQPNVNPSTFTFEHAWADFLLYQALAVHCLLTVITGTT